MLWMFAILFFGVLLTQKLFWQSNGGQEECLDSLFGDETQFLAVVTGTVTQVDQKQNADYLYLSKVEISVSDGESDVVVYPLEKLLLIKEKSDNGYSYAKDEFVPDCTVVAEGQVCKLDTAGNPGQFDEKAYYQQKNIYYKFWAEQIQKTGEKAFSVRRSLYRLRERIKAGFQRLLIGNHAGIAGAMILGDKSSLELEVRELYQANGIGHLLAISGLHVTILGLGLYRLLLFLRVPRALVPPAAVIFLVGYGMLTGYSVSTSRAVIMMVLLLFAEVFGRSYDMLSAFGFSGIVILYQTPYAVNSSGFYLSFGAVLGIAVLYPALKRVFLGDEEAQRKRKRLQKRHRKRVKAAFQIHHISETIPSLAWLFRENLLQAVLMNLAIQLAILPTLLYYYYEYPTYSIFLNLIVLPLAPVLVCLLAVGGILAVFGNFPAVVLLRIADLLLFLYERLCDIVVSLPGHLLVTGRPPMYVFVIYFICLFFLIVLSQRRHPRYCVILLAGTLLFFIPHTPSEFTATFLDVGQGDGIVLRLPSGITCLIDGGSSDVQRVGRYRLVPFLHYHGITTIDYMIVTHEDEDHISGQLELLDTQTDLGIQVKNLLLPQPDIACIGDNYKKLVALAQRQDIPITYLHTGDQIQSGETTITCLHPENGFAADSANAYSTTLWVNYGEVNVLLTGDLEKNGEEAVLQKMQALQTRFDVLKVAHHGSKNSTSESFLHQIQPQAAVISCGRKNRYGHPHRELLSRLEEIGCMYVTTVEKGAVTLTSDGNKLALEGWLDRR